MNCFIESFLEIILETLSKMSGELKEKIELLKITENKLSKDYRLKDKDAIYGHIMFILAQNHFFVTENGLTIKELAEISNKSEMTIRKTIKELLQVSLIDKKGEKPAYYSIRRKYFE
ncbi:Fic family protein [Paenibacillus xylanivorans]|uniref:Uncharacterized protein n=1 Tax=Paenibacillus xylanivorans TaxID=1705561 RepID=A0A0N0C3K5_9BACL|nr:hypothetical protein [Paenibacillus xylanivorans]KOY14437.1 hypothetical protein AMS66_20890 [Paenibacillus xylanivorans]